MITACTVSGGPEKSAVHAEHAVQAVQAVQRKSVLHEIPWDSISIEKRFTPLQRKLGRYNFGKMLYQISMRESGFAVCIYSIA